MQENLKLDSQPNQLANRAEAERKSGSDRLANTKSLAPFTSREADAPGSKAKIR
jgi:hypothetical protein